MSERIYIPEEKREYEKIYKNTTGKVETLLPCPFCGGKAFLFTDVTNEYITGTSVECSVCFIHTPKIYRKTKEEAQRASIEAWNRRAE